MKHRKLRIVWSVAWGVVAVLLCVLWFRSYGRVEGLWIVRDVNGNNGGLSLSSKAGHVMCAVEVNPLFVWGEWQIESRLDDTRLNPANAALDARNFDMDYGMFGQNVVYVKAPYLFYVLAAIVLLASPFLTLRRFSLRTLLIATTLIAVGLALIVWLR
jgi:hypothetical protein